LEFDHVHEVARGGEATIEGVRLRCRAHNQYAAECTFGSKFMKKKREEARTARDRPLRAGRTTDAQEVSSNWLVSTARSGPASLKKRR
jgi:hypothetical protein